MSSFRITTNGLYRNYRTNLYKNNKNLTDSLTTVQTGRTFNTYAEDPAAASKAWRLRRSYWRTGDQIDNNNYIISKFESAYTAMGSIIDGDAGSGEYGLGLEALLSTLKGASDSSGSSRNALGKELIESANNIVSMMNSKYGDEYVFAGADGKNLPFEWGEDGRLYYRGADVSVGKPSMPDDFGFTDEVMQKYGLTSMILDDDDYASKIDLERGKLEKRLSREEFEESLKSGAAKPAGVSDAQSLEDYLAEDSSRTEADYADYLYTTYKTAYVNDNQASTDANTIKLRNTGAVDDAFAEAQSLYTKLEQFQDYASSYSIRNRVTYAGGAEAYAQLERMAEESTYVDIGLGMKEKDNELVSGSAFNSAISGINFLGYGEDKNLVMIIKELGEIYSRADPDTGNFTQHGDANRADELLGKLQDSIHYAQDQHAQLSADGKYLKTNLKQLETNKTQLDEQIVNTEEMDMAEAITNMTWAQYCYNAALRIGTNLLSQSLLDYMS